MMWSRRRAEPSAEELMAIAREHAQAERYEEALAIWEPLARAGHARACNNIGACFAEGMGVERDPLMAERWLAPAAEAGKAIASACPARRIASLAPFSRRAFEVLQEYGRYRRQPFAARK